MSDERECLLLIKNIICCCKEYELLLSLCCNSQSRWERGQWAEGFSETTIKHTWTKPRRVEAREGGRFGGGGG